MSIHIQVRLAEPFWRSVGKREIQIQLSQGATMQSLLNKLKETYPKLEREFVEARPALFIDEEEAVFETILKDGDNVHIVWPIAGG